MREITVTRRPAVSWLPYVALAGGVLGIAWAAIFVKLAGVPGTASAFYRVLLASLVLLPWQAPRLRNNVSPQLLRLAALGGVFFALDLAFWNTSLLLTSVANSTLLVNTTPLWVGLGALLLFRERLRGWFWVGMVIAMGGAALILGNDLLKDPHLGAGDALALAGGLFYAAYLLTTQRVRTRLDALASMTVLTSAAAVTLFVLCLLLGIPLTGYSAQAWLALAGLGIVSQLGGVQLINYALGHIPAAQVSVTLLAQPVLAAGLAAWLLGEGLEPAQLAGGALVLIGVFVVHRFR